MADKIQTQRVLCQGGLFTNQNNILLSEGFPGSATRLINYEVSLAGGYRRINGYQPFDTDFEFVDPLNTQGPILGICIYKNNFGGVEYLVARRKLEGNEYSWYSYLSGVGWQEVETGLSLDFSDIISEVRRIRHVQFNFGEGNTVCFVDGVNNATLYDGESWVQINPNESGTSFDEAGGAQALEKPSLVTVFENHLFISGQFTDQAVVAHSSPLASYDWDVANGAGQLFAGFDVVQIQPYRSNNYILGQDRIRRIEVDPNGVFLIKDVTSNIGCIAPDSVVEIGGDLVFLSPDGFRPIAGTAKIGDIEIESISRPIQLLISQIVRDSDVSSMIGLVIRNKSQVRFFYGGSNLNEGIIGGMRLDELGSSSVRWEWGRLFGIQANVATSDFVGAHEVVIHGSFDGGVYQQEVGNSFNGENIFSVYSPPYLDQGDTEVNKTYRSLNTFIRAEGPVTIGIGIQYDWGDPDTLIPRDYVEELFGAPVIYNGPGVQYNTTNITYGGTTRPVIKTMVQGIGYSIRPSFITFGQDNSHSIQGFTLEFTAMGRKE